MHQKVLTVKEVAKQLGLGINQTYAACERGQIPSIRFGRRWVIPKPAFEKWLLESPAHLTSFDSTGATDDISSKREVRRDGAL